MEASHLITEIKGVGVKTTALFSKLHIETIKDLISYFPRGYDHYEEALPVGELCTGKVQSVRACIVGTPSMVRAKGMVITHAQAGDASGRMKLTWFRMPYLKKALPGGSWHVFRGMVQAGTGGMLFMEQPRVFSQGDYETLAGTWQPKYALTNGLTNHMISKCVRQALEELELPDYLDKLSAALGVRLCMPEDSVRGDSLLLLEAEPLAVSVGIASMRKKGEAVSGDRGTYFKTDAGQLCVILSDGMGCGESAADGSIGTVGMLEEFLRSGVSPALAMKLLNSAMLLRDGENWGYATVDLMCMNLFTGEADFYKYGAAPTYVKSGGALKKLRCTSFAPGLEQESGKAPDELHMHLKPGSVAVIASDGVVSDGQDLWLRRLLNDFEDGDMKTLAGSVVRAAIREYGRGDDMTALAVKVEVRS